MIENTSRGPNVCFLAVRLTLHNFRTEINDEIYTLNADVKREKDPYLIVNVFSTKVLIEDTIFLLETRPRRHFTWSRGHPSQSKVYPFAGQKRTFISQLFLTDVRP